MTMTPGEERAFTDGTRMVWAAMLQECVRRLGYDSSSHAVWIAEREEAITVLRRLCAEHGDNDWEDQLHLGDVIDKHLGRHL